MMVEGSPRIMAVATQGVQSGASIVNPKEQEDKKDRDHTEQGVNCLTPERPCFIPIKQDSTDAHLSRWKKLRTTVQLGSAVTQAHKKHCLKREDSFIKRFSARPPPVVPDARSSPRRWRRCGVSTVLNPYESLLFWWLWILTGCVLYNAWTLIVRQAFPELQESLSALWHTADGCSDLVFLLDVVVQFRTGYLEQGIMVRDGVQLARHYVTSRAFFLDVAALIPLDLAQMWIGPFPLLRLPRFLKVQRTYNFYYTVESRTAYPNLWRVVNLVHVLLLLAHWFGCFYYMLSELENFEGNWSYPRPEKEYSTLVRKYLGSVYWSTLTLTTIGDLATPATNLQYLFTIISYLIGVFIFATIVGQVGNVITNRNASRLEFERLLDGAKLYMRHHKVPREMQRRVQRWYDYSWSRGRMQGGGDINSALGILPDKLKTELALHVNLKTLKKVTIFQECQPEFLYDLVLKMKAYIFTPGDLICRKGEVAREMFIIADGILEVINEIGQILTQMKAGDFFGEIGILNLDGFNRRTADVRSVGYSELFSLSREDVLMAMKDYPDAQDILHSMGRKRLMEARVKSPGKEEDGGKKTEKSSTRLLGNRSAKSIADHNKISGEHSVLKKVKDNFFPLQQKSGTTEKSEANKGISTEILRDSSPKKWPPVTYSAGNFPATEKRLHPGLNLGSSQSSITSHDLLQSANSICSSTNILFKTRRTSVEQSKNKSPQLSSVSQRNVTPQDMDYKDNRLSNNYLSINKKPKAWRRFSDVVASFGTHREDMTKDSLQSVHRESKPMAFSTCAFSTSQDAALYANDSTISIKAWKQIQSDMDHATDSDKVVQVSFDCTAGDLDNKPNPIQKEMEIQQSGEDCNLKNGTEASQMPQILTTVLSGKVMSASRRSKKSSQRNSGKRNRHRNRRKSNKATSPIGINVSAPDVNSEDGQQSCEYRSKPGDQKSESADPIRLAILRYFHCDTAPAEEGDSSQAEKEFIPEDIARQIEESSSLGNINEFLSKVTEDIQFAVKTYIQMQKQGGLRDRIVELEELIKERDEVITQLKSETEWMENVEKENIENGNQAANENPGHSVIDTSKHANEQIMPRISKSGLPEKHVQFSQDLSQDEDASKPLPLPDIVEYMELSTEDPCEELEEDDLWRVEFPDNDIQVKKIQMRKRPKMRRHSSVEVGSETPMHLLHFVSGGQRVQHLLPPHLEEACRMTARRYSESQTKAEVGEPNQQSFAARVRKVFQKIKANAEVKVSTNVGSKDTSSILNLGGRSSKRLSDGGFNIGGHQHTAWVEKPRRYSDTLLRSTNASSDCATTSSENGSGISNTRRISSEGNLGRTGFRTLPTITEDDFIRKLIPTSFDSTFEEGCQDSLPINEAHVSCVVELPPEVVFRSTNSETIEKSPCRQKT